MVYVLKIYEVPAGVVLERYRVDKRMSECNIPLASAS